MGGTLPAQEFLAALAITAVAVLVLRSLRSQQSPQLGTCAALVAAAVAVHAMLHGLEAPADGSALLWWLGAFSGSVLASGGSFLALRRLPLPGPVECACCWLSAAAWQPWGRSAC